MIELLVMATMLVVGVLSIVGALNSSRDLTSRAQTLEAASHVAQQELEAMQSMTWVTLAHAATPVSGPAPHLVSGTNYQHRAGVWEPIAVAPGVGTLTGAATTWSEGRLSGRMWRYVTWVDDACCAGTQDYKRLTVVTTVDNARAIRTPVVVSTLAARKDGV
jgi:Tfp pilus assembly protein PilV